MNFTLCVTAFLAGIASSAFVVYVPISDLELGRALSVHIARWLSLRQQHFGASTGAIGSLAYGLALSIVGC